MNNNNSSSSLKNSNISSTNNRFLVIVNPKAGKRKAKNDWAEIETHLNNNNIEYEAVFTKYKRHAISIVKNNIEENHFTKIIAIGGDGTIHEVVNGMFLQKRFATSELLLGVITIGTGNDWAKMFNLPSNYSEAIKIIKENNIFVQDVGKVNYFIGEKKDSRYFVNAAGLGFDAMVTEATNKKKEEGKSNAFSYLSSLIKSLYSYKSNKVIVATKSREIYKGNLFTLSLGIGKYTGGGMQQTPNSILDDGLFDLMLIEKIAKMKVIRKVKKLFDGNINKIKEVQSLQTDHLIVESDSKLMLEVDGENIGHAPFDFELIPLSLNIIVPKIN